MYEILAIVVGCTNKFLNLFVGIEFIILKISSHNGVDINNEISFKFSLYVWNIFDNCFFVTFSISHFSFSNSNIGEYNFSSLLSIS